MHDIRVGQLVMSTAGHDKDNKFIILSIIDEQNVYISDGYLRNVNHPKKKKIKHLKNLDCISQVISSKALSGQKIYDGEIRQFIKSVDREREREV